MKSIISLLLASNVSNATELKLSESNSWELVKSCPFDMYFMQGLEVLPNSNKMLISTGWYKKSKIGIVEYDWDTCEFKETFM